MRYIFHRPSDHLTAVLDKHRMTGHRQCRAVLLRDVHHLTTNTILSQSLSASHSISLTRHQHVLPTPPLHYVTHGHPLPSHLPLLVLTPSLYVTHPSLCYSITLYDTHPSLCYLTLPSSPPHPMSPHVPLLPTPPYVTHPSVLPTPPSVTRPSLCYPPHASHLRSFSCSLLRASASWCSTFFSCENNSCFSCFSCSIFRSSCATWRTRRQLYNEIVLQTAKTSAAQPAHRLVNTQQNVVSVVGRCFLIQLISSKTGWKTSWNDTGQG